jgi:integral membrane protein
MTGSSTEARSIGAPSLSGLVQRGTVGALIRYRVMAFIVGTALICLFIVIIFQLCGFKVKLAEEIVAPIHGYLYLVYLVTAADLARRAHWKLGRILVVVAAGFVPTLAFIVEHRVYQQMQAEWATEAAALHQEAVGSAVRTPDHRTPLDEAEPDTR